MLVKDQKPPEDILAADLKNVPRMKKKMSLDMQVIGHC